MNKFKKDDRVRLNPNAKCGTVYNGVTLLDIFQHDKTYIIALADEDETVKIDNFWVGEDALELESEQFKPGTKVICKDGLEDGKKYGEITHYDSTWINGPKTVRDYNDVGSVMFKEGGAASCEILKLYESMAAMTFRQKQEFVDKFCKAGSCEDCPCDGEFCDAIIGNKSEEELDAVIAKIDAAGLSAEDVDDGWPSSQAYLEAHGAKPTPAEPEVPTRIHETVNHPDHYQGEHECIEVMRAMFGDEAVKGFCRCNAYKYRFRADQKNGEEDLRKARWYEDYLIKMEAED